MFLFILLCILTILLMILFIDIEIKITKRDNLYLEISILNIKVYSKLFEKNRSNNKFKLNITHIIHTYGIGYVKGVAYKILKILIKLKSKIKFKKASVNVCISNANYVRGGYYIGAIETMTMIGKMITNKFEIYHRYKTQDKDLQIGFCLIFKFKIIKIFINLINLAIILIRFIKKGNVRNGTTSNRKFNDDCNVVN